jgi:hypothetical protein
VTAVNSAASQQAVVEAALVLLERMGLSPADLTAVPQVRKPVPTFTDRHHPFTLSYHLVHLPRATIYKPGHRTSRVLARRFGGDRGAAVRS